MYRSQGGGTLPEIQRTSIVSFSHGSSSAPADFPFASIFFSKIRSCEYSGSVRLSFWMFMMGKSISRFRQKRKVECLVLTLLGNCRSGQGSRQFSGVRLIFINRSEQSCIRADPKARVLLVRLSRWGIVEDGLNFSSSMVPLAKPDMIWLECRLEVAPCIPISGSSWWVTLVSGLLFHLPGW